MRECRYDSPSSSVSIRSCLDLRRACLDGVLNCVADLRLSHIRDRYLSHDSLLHLSLIFSIAMGHESSNGKHHTATSQIARHAIIFLFSSSDLALTISKTLPSIRFWTIQS